MSSFAQVAGNRLAQLGHQLLAAEDARAVLAVHAVLLARLAHKLLRVQLQPRSLGQLAVGLRPQPHYLALLRRGRTSLRLRRHHRLGHRLGHSRKRRMQLLSQRCVLRKQLLHQRRTGCGRR